MREIRKRIEGALHDDLPVLIEGESGTGKEVVGRFLHKSSDRGEGSFLKLNCGAAPASQLEGEMYGYEKSAIPDTARLGSGSIGLGSEGTLFLDEIGDMDLRVQQKLAETLKTGCYRRLDGKEDLPVNARLVCATSIDLEDGLRNHTFLGNLLGLLDHHRVRLIPLRERKEDIPQLCEYLLGKFAHDFGRPVPRLSSDVLDAFQQWKWPGNIRELENWIARIVIFGAEEVIGLQFSRQLVVREEPVLRSHHAVHVKMSRARRLRRHR